jgi:hypothetical protein
MIAADRNTFNKQFSESAYRNYLDAIDALFPGALDFRVAETPVFVPASFKNSMLQTSEAIIDRILRNDFMDITQTSIPPKYQIPNGNNRPEMLIFDYGVCEDAQGQLQPQLIELQGFPSLFAYQHQLDLITRNYANISSEFSSYLSGFDAEKYVRLLQSIILEDVPPENVILLEIYPEAQKTRIDFHCTEKLLGIKTVCLTKLKAEGKQLFYNNGETWIPIKRIFNRLIFDDLEHHQIANCIDLKQSYEVEWVSHPDWFYRISKYLLPYLKHPHIPETFFLHEFDKSLPPEDFVLKPLFSFAGSGVIIDVTHDDIYAIKDPENWIMQRKVNYADIIATPDLPAKAEIRLFYFWKKEWERPLAVHNLTRLSKGKMIGTRYNKDKTWVGGTIAYFEK